MKYLITGGCGFLGSNIAAELLRQSEEVVIFDSLYRYGSSLNLDWLREQGEFEFIHADIRNTNDVERTIKTVKPDVIYHLAGQVAMTTSIADPRMDFEVNAAGSFNLLNAVRLYSPESIVIYSSTNKVYGDLEQYAYRETPSRYVCQDLPDGFDENTPLDFHSPYGASKGSADQYMLDFARIYGIRTIVFRHSSMYGGRQFSTFDQGWVGWFSACALDQSKGNRESFTISGNGKQVRDLLHAEDCIQLYLSAVGHVEPLNGNAFNIGGGIEYSLSILELLEMLSQKTGTRLKYSHIDARASDQKVFVADSKKIQSLIGWNPKVSASDGVDHMLKWLER